MLPVLLKPRLYSFKHRWHRGSNVQRQWARDGIIASLTIVMMIGTYLGGIWALEQTRTQLDFAYFHSSLILGLILVFLLIMLFVTNLVSALSALFMARDLTFILSSPITPLRLFVGKLVEILVTSSWMTMVFLLPLVLVFGRFYQATGWYYLLSLIVYIPYFLIPAAGAMIFATAIILLLPVHRKREILLITVGGVIYGLYFLAGFLSSEVKEADVIDVVDITQLISFLSVANTTWSPSFWTASALGEVLEPIGKNAFVYVTLLYSFSLMLIALAFLLLRLCHARAHSKASAGSSHPRRSKVVQFSPFAKISSFFRGPSWALAAKEFRTASRDITQSFQAFLLLGLCALYLYMLKLQHLFNHVIPEADRSSWRILLIIVNACLEAFIITSMGTRLVFPSISREAQSFWILLSSPMSLRRLLLTKLHTWWIPIAAITSLVFGLAAFSLYGAFSLAVFKALSTCLLCFALVGMGTGLGAYFAQFDWEHPSQLTTGFGSLVYMVCAVLLIAVNLLIGAFMISFSFVRSPEIQRADPLTLGILAIGSIGLVLLNITVAIISLRIGERALQERF